MHERCYASFWFHLNMCNVGGRSKKLRKVVKFRGFSLYFPIDEFRLKVCFRVLRNFSVEMFKTRKLNPFPVCQKVTLLTAADAVFASNPNKMVIPRNMPRLLKPLASGILMHKLLTLNCTEIFAFTTFFSLFLRNIFLEGKFLSKNIFSWSLLCFLQQIFFFSSPKEIKLYSKVVCGVLFLVFRSVPFDVQRATEA